MRRSLWALLLLTLTAAPSSSQEPPVIATQDPLTPAEEQKKFQLPPGFEIQLVASEPDIAKPMNLSFDDRGRLYVTSSVEYPFPAKDPMAGRDTVRVLEDFGPDGKARKISTLVNGLSIPIGQYPTADGVICHSIPKIWKCSDIQDGVCRKREPLYGDVGFRDTHGMVNAFTPGLDGWWYACHGFSNESTLKSASTDSVIKMTSGNTFRFRPDGSKIEHYTNGQVNPFGLCFDPLHNLYSADCHSLPIYQLLRNGWYPTFGGSHDGLGVAPSIMNHLHGSTAIGGIVYYAATQFPEKYRDTVFVGNPVTGRIDHDKMEVHGSSFKAIEQPDFLKTDDRWFRPVDLKLAPDGSMYVADFYNRIIGHYEVALTHPGRDRERGRIWRIVYKGEGATEPKPMPDLTTLAAADLVKLLNDDNLQVRFRATNQLADRIGKAGDDEVRKALDGTPWQKAHGMWVLERHGALDEAAVRKLAADADRLVRVHAFKALCERATWTFEAELCRGALKDADPYVRRAAAEALGLHPAKENIKPLIELWNTTAKDDTHLIHMARMSLRDQLAPAGTFALLGGLLGDDKTALGRIANVCVAVKTEEAGTFALAWMKSQPLDGGQMATFLKHVIRYGPQDGLAEAFELAKSTSTRPPREQIGLVRSVNQGCQERGIKPPDAFGPWARGLVASALKLDDRGVVQEALKLCREVRIDGVYEEVEAVALHGKHQDLRSAAIDALPQIDAKRTIATLGRLVANPEENTATRLKAVTSLSSLNRPDARDEMVAQLKTASTSTAVAIAAGLAQTNEGAEKLLAAIAEGKASLRLLADKGVEGRMRTGKPKEIADKFEKIVKDLPPDDERINKLIAVRKSGYGKAKPDAAHGLEVFTKTCSGCHRLDGKGQKVGPELDGVWGRGVERLLEDVLDPNRNVDQAFRATLIKTTDGRVISGLVLREEGAVLVVQEAADKETRVPVKDIEQRVLSQLSPMPTNVTEALSEPDFYDLMAYLLQPRGK